ncbi:MAG: LysM peptidoglycan-binding domain-containing protein [Betaproteobacteria bacterium]
MSMPLPPACPGGQLYTIARGDTLFQLARRFGTTVEALRAANPQITNPNVLVIGQQICIPRGVTPPAPPPGPLPLPPACPEGRLHTVAPGETLFSIANRFGVALSRVIAANPQLQDPNAVVPGQVICVPLPAVGFPEVPPPPPACPGGTIVTVAAGETMAGIARRFGVGLQQMIAANPQVIDPNSLLVGQRLCVPGVITPPSPPPTPTCPGGTLYTVQAGDTMFAIARRFGVTLDQLRRANPQVADPNALTVGQRLCIPGRPAEG